MTDVHMVDGKVVEEEIAKILLREAVEEASDVLFCSDVTKHCELSYTRKKNGYIIRIEVESYEQ